VFFETTPFETRSSRMAPPLRRKIAPILILTFFVCAVGLGVVRTFGQNVQHKFESANISVANEVTFGGDYGGDYDYESSAPERVIIREIVHAAPYEAPSHDSQSGESYEDHGVNPRTSTLEDRFSTFSIDVDTGSYTVVRRKLNEGYDVPQAAVRVEEFLNYFDYDYPDPEVGPFAVYLEAAPSPFTAKPNTYLMRVGVQGERISVADRKPVHLTFLVDVSGSMGSPDKLGMVKTSLKTLVEHLHPRDTVALATYAGHTAVVLEHTSARERGRIVRAIEGLDAGGGTAMASGMQAAYGLAFEAKRPGEESRVIVLSDGDANIGATSRAGILSRVRGYVDEGVTLSAIGFGMGNYKDSAMEQLANEGNGNYFYIDHTEEAYKVFGKQVDGTLTVIAKDVKIQVEFDPEAVKTYRLIGYENRDIADEDFRRDEVDAGEIGAGHSVTAFYEVEMDPGASSELAYVRIRAKKPEGTKADEQTFVLEPQDVHRTLAQASLGFQFGAGVVAFAEKLRKSPYAARISWGSIEELVEPAVEGKGERIEALRLIRTAAKK